MRTLCLGGPMLFDTAMEARARRFLRGSDFGMAYIVALVLTLIPSSSLLDRLWPSRSSC